MHIGIALLDIDKDSKVVNGELHINKMHCADIQLYSQTDPIKITPTGLKQEQLIQEAEIHCNNLYVVKTNNEQVEFVPVNLDLYMRGQIRTKLLDKLSENNIIFGKEDGEHQTCNLSTPLKMLSESPIGEVVLIVVMQDFIVPRLKEGERIWPNNLPDHVRNIVGKEHFHDREPKYIKKENLRMFADHPHKKGGPKL